MDHRIVSADRKLVALDESAMEANFGRAKWLTPDPQNQHHWSGVVGSTWWFYFTGPSVDEVWSSYLVHSRAMLDSGVERPSLICIAHRADPPSVEHRRWISEYIKEDQVRLRSLRGFALVMDSPLHVMALKAINWVVKKPFPEKVCGSPITAVRWLEAQGAELDERALLNSVRRAVPPEHMWRDL
jgi:hypothetical protein